MYKILKTNHFSKYIRNKQEYVKTKVVITEFDFTIFQICLDLLVPISSNSPKWDLT